ncbi:metallophosphoesterase family protein [Parvularcula oceani]|uniref:metallophosphoesterase family protein n=1 Tax=Parvularcula oceani TaxID=1247963 RepID=UPI0012DCFCC9|nr:metallophosphoesterase family protein [Parvularcula oceani]
MLNAMGSGARRDDAVLAAIGDVHGCADLLRRLIERVEERFAGRRLRFVLLGDYVDRGPDSRGVLDALLALRARRPDSVFLKGNHEQAMLDFLGAGEAAAAWLHWGGEETLASYGVSAAPPLEPAELQMRLAEALPDVHFALLMDLPLFHREGRYLFVHAGLNPERPLEEQEERDLLWIRDAFYRKGKNRFGDLVVVHGHTPVPTPEDLSWRVNVDTGAVWSSRLSALCLDGEERIFLST